MKPEGTRKLHDNYAPAGFFVLRTPLLPFQDFLSWTDESDSQAYLSGVFAEPLAREGLLLASSSLEKTAAAWLENPQPGDTDVPPALTRIFARMAGRTTPSGLFAGWTLGELGGRTRLMLKGREQYRRKSGLDVGFLRKLLLGILKDPEVRDQVRFVPNSTLYSLAGQVRYVERRETDGGEDAYLCAVEETPLLKTAIAASARGVRLTELRAMLPEDGTPESLRAHYVGQLVEMQILTSLLEPRITGEGPLETAVRDLAAIRGAALLRDALREVQSKLSKADKGGTPVSGTAYREMEARLLHASPVHSVPKPFQIDMMKPAQEMTLAARMAAEALRGIEILRRIEPKSRDLALDEFKERFLMRFEERAVPLLTALDPDHGVPFSGDSAPHPLVEGLPPPEVGNGPSAPWLARDGVLLRWVEEAWVSGKDVIELTPDQLDMLSAEREVELPDAFAVFFAIGAANNDAIDRGDFSLFVRGAYGPSGAEFMARFCSADEALHRHVRRHLEREEAARPGALFAEVVHRPDAELVNIVRRPVLRDFEIPYLGMSGAPPERQIPVQDLVLQIVDGKFRLYSQSRGCEVIPRLTTAHNYTRRTPALYRFLGALRGQDAATGVEWSWGPLSDAKYLPRVTSGRLILSRARWRLDAAALAEIPLREGRLALTVWRQRLRMPRCVLLVDDDRELPIDLENPQSVAGLLQWATPKRGAVVVEMLPEHRNLPVSGPEGRFVHEIILPFAKRPDREQATVAAVSSPACPRPGSSVHAPGRRPGDGWLYFKLYGGSAALDRVLMQTIAPLIERLGSSGLINSWFFVRYMDPSLHLRLRMKGASSNLIHRVLPEVLRATDADLSVGRIHTVAIDTYEREIERYGGCAGLDVAEKIFCADSNRILSILRSLPRGELARDIRWKLAMAAVDGLLDDCGYPLERKHHLVGRLRNGYRKEHNIGLAELREIGRKHRSLRRELESLLINDGSTLNRTFAGARPMCRDPELAALCAELRSLDGAGTLERSFEDVATDLVHMRVNRHMATPDSRIELMLYEFLYRIYASQLAQTNPQLARRSAR